MAKERASASRVREELKAARERWGWSPSEVADILRGRRSSAKGSEYERELCKRFSLWWTNGGRDDVFWRSSGSGARAKVRGRRGANTAGQHGDMAATDAIGTPLIDLFTIEIKRGYNEHTLQDLIDKPASAGLQEWENWFSQAAESHEQAGSFSWLLITRRDRREALVWMPEYARRELVRVGCWAGGPPPTLIRMRVPLRISIQRPPGNAGICGTTLGHWLDGVPPEAITRLSSEV